MRGNDERACLQSVQELWYQMDTTAVQPNHLTELKRAVFQASEPVEMSKFPDFCFSDGFIEHFKVTSADESGKGSKQNIQQANFERTCENFAENIEEHLEDFTPRGPLGVNVQSMKSPEYSYSFYRKSFQKNFSNHLESLRKYSTPYKTGIFMIELTGATFKVMLNGRYTGKLYQLSFDTELLEYLYEYRDRLKYIIFVQNDRCEAVDLNFIPNLLNRLPKDLTFEAGRYSSKQINILL